MRSMPKYYKLAFLLAGLALIAVIILLIYNDREETVKETPAQPFFAQPEQLFKISVLSALEGPVREIVSDTFKSLLDKYGANQERFTVRITPDADNIGPDLLDEAAGKETDIFITHIGINEKTKAALDKTGFKYKRIGFVPYGVIVSKSLSGLTELNSTALGDILNGRINDWSGLSDKLTGKINICLTANFSIMVGVEMPSSKELYVNSSGEIINRVARDVNSMGIIPLSGINPADNAEITVLKINGLQSSDKDVVVSGRYPYTAALYLMWKPEMENHNFFKEFAAGLDDAAALEKYYILKNDALSFRVSSGFEKPCNGIVSDIFNKLKDKYNIPPAQFIIRNTDDIKGIKKGVDIYIQYFYNSELNKKHLEALGFNNYEIGYVPHAFVTSGDVKAITNLDSAQLKNIIAGQVNEWSKISAGLEGRINIWCYRKATLGRWVGLNRNINVREADPKEILNAVNRDKNVLGVVPLLALKGLPGVNPNNFNILSIDNVLPTDEEAVKSGRYHYTTPYYLIWDRALESDDASKKLLDELKAVLADRTIINKYSIYRGK